MALQVFDNVKYEMLLQIGVLAALGDLKIQLLNASGTVVGTNPNNPSQNYRLIIFDVPSEGEIVQDDGIADVVFNIEAGDNVRGFRFYDVSEDELYLTYLVDTTYNYATAGTFTVSGTTIKIN